MNDPDPLGGDERFVSRYRVVARDEKEARERAARICIEQTVEFPPELLAGGEAGERIEARVLGRVEAVARGRAPGAFFCDISFGVDTVGEDLPQLLNVLFGNSSIKAGLRLEQLLSMPPWWLRSLGAGPRHGRDGLRRLLGVPHRPLLCTALKPMGLQPAALADIAHRCALGGIDLIKDDHGLADQPFCRFDERVSLCAEAVARANQQTGERCLYLANVSAPADRIADRIEVARAAGAGGLLVAPGLIGWDALRLIAAESQMPLLCHPALLGSYLMSRDCGISHRVLLGQLPRLFGADATIFPHQGGRFAFSADDCRELAGGCGDDIGGLASIFPVPAGGMSLQRVPEVCAFYGPEVVLLIGGDLHRGGDLVARCRAFRALVDD